MGDRGDGERRPRDGDGADDREGSLAPPPAPSNGEVSTTNWRSATPSTVSGSIPMTNDDEADESDGSFLFLSPTATVVTNIDPEHLDHYGSVEALEDTFVEFANRVPFYGFSVMCLDHRRIVHPVDLFSWHNQNVISAAALNQKPVLCQRMGATSIRVAVTTHLWWNCGDVFTQLRIKHAPPVT